MSRQMAFTANLFGKLAPYYDALHRTRDYAGETEFISSVFRHFTPSATARTLELFCGTGGHSLVAARQGLEVVAVDISPDMLDIAQRKASAAAAAVAFQLADCRTLRFDEDFDLVFGFGQSFHYLVTYHDIACVLRGVHSALRPGGICIFDMINGWKMLEPHEARYFDAVADGTRIVRMVNVQPNQTRRIALSEVIWLIQLPDGHLELEKTTEEYRIFFLDELEFLLEVSGFELLDVYGDYRLDSARPKDCLAVSVAARKVASARSDLAEVVPPDSIVRLGRRMQRGVTHRERQHWAVRDDQTSREDCGG
jgi:SAM-dependent methyltransferase